MIDLFTAEFNNLNDDQRYSAIVALAQTQPAESNRHDFKVIWTNEALKDVAAFANTFGGILIIGVEKNQRDPEAKVVGVTSNSELATGIASSIATNISPTPSYDIMECNKSGETNKRLCVIRVRSDSRLYLVTKKDISSPVWVRNADQTVRADAAQLRGMIDRERQSEANAPELFLKRAHRLLEDMPIGQHYSSWPTGNWYASETYFKLALIPAERRTLALDGRDEQRFVNLVHNNYRRVRSTLSGTPPPASSAENRSADYYEHRWYHNGLEYEGRWRITSSLEIAHSTQIKEDAQWSLMDVVSYAVLLLKVGAGWWKSFNYLGDGVLVAELAVGGLQLRQGRAGEFSGLFRPSEGDFAIGPDALIVHAQQRSEAKANVGVNFSTMREELPRTVTALMNGLLRSLGHSVLLAEFEDNMRTIFARAS
jgi:hypothetical protein